MRRALLRAAALIVALSPVALGFAPSGAAPAPAPRVPLAPQVQPPMQSTVDLNLMRPQDLVICDGTTVIEGNYPMDGRARSVGFLAASRNAVALDVAVGVLAGFDPHSVAYLRDAHQRGMGPLALDEIDARREAISLLERATLLDPEAAECQLTLARAYYRAGFVKLARQRFERVTRMAPADARGRYGLGQVWRRDWLKFLDPSSLTRAVLQLSSACRLDPTYAEAWLLMTPLLVDLPPGCAFRARCDRATDACRADPPPAAPAPKRLARCFHPLSA